MLEAATSTAKLVKTDLNDQTILLPRDKVTVGITAKSMLAKSKASELQKMEFMMECRKFLVATIQKILERCPLKYKATHAVASLDPVSVSASRTVPPVRLE